MELEHAAKHAAKEIIRILAMAGVLQAFFAALVIPLALVLIREDLVGCANVLLNNKKNKTKKTNKNRAKDQRGDARRWRKLEGDLEFVLGIRVLVGMELDS